MNKKSLIASIATLSFAVTLAAAAIVQSGQRTIKSNAEEHSATSNCYWNHYSGQAATSSSIGCKEYWVCCDHHYIQLEEPTVGQHLDADPLAVPSSVLIYLDENPDDVRFIEKQFLTTYLPHLNYQYLVDIVLKLVHLLQTVDLILNPLLKE